MGLFYSHLSDVLVEGVKLFTISHNEFNKLLVLETELTDPETKAQSLKAMNLIRTSTSCIGMLGHYGNWELGSFASPLKFPDRNNWVVYRTLNDKNFDILIKKIRSRFGAEMVETKNVLRKFVNKGDKPQFAYFASDQSPMIYNASGRVTFLNQETLVYMGAEKIASSRDIPVFYFEFKKLKRGLYTVIMEVLSEKSATLTPLEINQRFQSRLEKSIREQPEYWLWSHKRWKYTRIP